MPELPEVETIRKDLQRRLRGSQIEKISVPEPKIVRLPVRSFQRRLRGQKFKAVERRGKLLMFTLADSEYTMLAHLKMTGQFFHLRARGVTAGGHGQELPAELPNKHTRVIFELGGGDQLLFNDIRKFGYLDLVDPDTKQQVLQRYGPEPLSADFTVEYLYDVLKRRQSSLKSVLLNQQLIAGLGNIYVDEACFRAGVRPSRRANRVTLAEAKKLHRAIQQVIALAIKKRGTTFSDYRDASGRSGSFYQMLKVYDRAGQLCKRCRSATIKKITLNGRGTHYCPTCQQ